MKQKWKKYVFKIIRHNESRRWLNCQYTQGIFLNRREMTEFPGCTLRQWFKLSLFYVTFMAILFNFKIDVKYCSGGY